MAVPFDADSRKYYRVAMQRLDEAELVLAKIRLFRATIYLGGYAVECMLKALLIERTSETKRPELLSRSRWSPRGFDPATLI